MALESEAGAKPTPKLLVALDAGHGGEDVGAIGPKGLQEKEAAMRLSRGLAAALEGKGFSILQTREDDVLVPLWERARKANAAGADLFVSLHLNAAKAKGARGSEVYFLSLDKARGEDEAVEAAENAGAVARPQPESVVASILDDLAQKAFLEDSEKLAVAIQKELNRLAGIKARGVKQAHFIVLRSAAMPAVLVETAFISNPREEQKLKDEAFVAKVADAIARGIRSYLAGSRGPVRRRAESES